MWKCFAIAGLWACSHRSLPSRPGLAEWLAATDAAWLAGAASTETHGVEPLDLAWSADPTAPSVLWRVARRELARAESSTDETAALRQLARARELAMSCVPGPIPYGAAPTQVDVWMGGVDADGRACLRWGVKAWNEWSARFGGAEGALDAQRVRFLSAAAQRLTDG